MNYGKRKLPVRTLEGDVGSSTQPIKDDTVKRNFRNLNEKKRRDQFNMLINELAAIVCSSDSRRADKTRILEQAIQFLDGHKEAESSLNENISYSWKPSFLSHDEFAFLMLEAMDYVTMALDEQGVINFISDNAQRKLGFLQEIVNQDMKLEEFLSDSSLMSSLIHSAKEQPKQLYRVEALVTTDDDRSRFQAVDLFCVSDSSSSAEETSKALYNCVLRVTTPALSSEYIGPHDVVFKGRYSLEWKILHLESRLTMVLGYQPFEILGTSGYDYYHPEDIQHIVTAHKKLLQSGCCKTPLHRMCTKSQGWIWIQSDMFMCYNQWSGKPEHIECTHTVPSKEAVDFYKKGGPSIENLNSSPVTKRPRPPRRPVHRSNSSAHSSSSGGQSSSGQGSFPVVHGEAHLPRPDVFAAHLAASNSQYREHRFGRQPPKQVTSHLSQRDEPEYPLPMQANPAQESLHMQLQAKYDRLKSRLERQHEELSQLFGQLDIASTPKPASSEYHQTSDGNIHRYGDGGITPDVANHQCKQQ